jgi:cytochrome c biogenesis protein CcmG/thiol:disulfide interchange protein DsbE
MAGRRALLFAAPLLATLAGGAGFYAMLRRMQTDKFDPHALPSPLIGHRLPPFSLPGIDGGKGFANTDLAAPARPMLINWFASWCAPCMEEAPMLTHLAALGIPLWGIAYQDTASAIAAYLARFGNPFIRLASDASGLTAINWGVYGVPETYLIDRQGIVRWRWAGALDQDVVAGDLVPLLRRYA